MSKQGSVSPVTGIQVMFNTVMALAGAYMVIRFTEDADLEMLLESQYLLLESLVGKPGGPPKSMTREEAMRRPRLELPSSRSREIMQQMKEALPRQEDLYKPSDIGGVPVGTRSTVRPEIPPVGTLLPVDAMIRDEWLGGGILGYGDDAVIDDIDVRDKRNMPEIVEAAFRDFVKQVEGMDFYPMHWTEDEDALEAFIYWYQTEVTLEEYDSDEIMEMLYDGTLAEDYEEWQDEAIVEAIIEWHTLRQARELEETINGTPYKIEGYEMALMNRDGTTTTNLSVENMETGRIYDVHDLLDLFRMRGKGIPLAEDDIHVANMMQWLGRQGEPERDMEVRRAVSHYLYKAAKPGFWEKLRNEWWSPRGGCEAQMCYRPPASIMDPDLQVAKNLGDAGSVSCTVVGTRHTYDYDVDYCWFVADIIKRNTEEKLQGVTWSGTGWYIDVCGLHVETRGGENYTVPPEQILEYMLGRYNTPQYLQGDVCVSMYVMTPEMMSALEGGEQELLSEWEEEEVSIPVTGKEEEYAVPVTSASEQEKELERAAEEMAVSFGYAFWDGLGAGEQQRFLEEYEGKGREAAVNLVRTYFPRGGEWGSVYADNIHVNLAEHAELLISPHVFARFLLDLGRDRKRVSIKHEVVKHR